MFHSLSVDVLDAAGRRRSRLGQHVDRQVRDRSLAADGRLVREAVLEELPALSGDRIPAEMNHLNFFKFKYKLLVSRVHKNKYINN